MDISTHERMPLIQAGKTTTSVNMSRSSRLNSNELNFKTVDELNCVIKDVSKKDKNTNNGPGFKANDYRLNTLTGNEIDDDVDCDY